MTADGPFSLRDRRILVVGGTAGIGLACAEALLAAGAVVTIAGRREDHGRKTAARIGAGFVRGDAAVADDATRMVGAAAHLMGGLDTLVSGAGGNTLPRLLHEIPPGELMPEIGSVLAPVILPARAALDLMRPRGDGTIILIASDAGKVATPGEAAIGAAMAAIAMFARGMAIEGKRFGLRVNTLTPSIVRDTDFYARLMADPFAGKLFAKAEAAAQLGVVTPADIARLAVFLASPAARHITGQTISVTGGISAI